MMERRLGLARYRFRSTLRHRWGGYLALVVLVGLIGGLGLGSLSAARRTQSSFSTFVASTNPSDLIASVFAGGTGANNPNYDPALTAAIARLPHVTHVAPALEVVGAPLTADGSPRIRVTGLRTPWAASTDSSSPRTVWRFPRGVRHHRAGRTRSSWPPSSPACSAGTSGR